METRKIFGYQQNDYDLYTLGKLTETGDFIDLRIGICRYFQYITACGGLEEETLNKFQIPWSLLRIRNKKARNLETLTLCPLGAHGIGIHCLVALRRQYGWEILLQERAHGTVTHGGKWGVVPTFAFQPQFASFEKELAFEHQFFREFGEELLGLEELASRNSRYDYDWFYTTEQIRPFVSLRDSGKLSVRLLGFGFDALNGEPNIGLLACIDDPSAFDKAKTLHKHNWEIKGICYYDANDPKVKEMLFNRRMSPGSAFALSEGLRFLGNN